MNPVKSSYLDYNYFELKNILLNNLNYCRIIIVTSDTMYNCFFWLSELEVRIIGSEKLRMILVTELLTGLI